METDDEDVILPNSPLYEYFKELNDNQCLEEHHEVKKYPNIIFSTFLGKLPILSPHLFYHSVISYFHNLLLVYFSRIQLKRYQLYLQILIDKKLVITEDEFFLKNCFDDLNTHDRKQTLSGHLILLLLLSLLLWLTCSFVTLVVEVTSCCLISNLIYLFMLLFLPFVIYVINRCYKTFWSIDSKLSKVCTNVRQLIDSLKKTYKMIQETELIARGFASASGISVAERLEVSNLLSNDFKHRQLPELRKFLFIWLRQSYIQYRQATCNIIELMPLASEFPSQYFATMPLEQFGVLLKYDPHSVDGFQKLLEVSDNLSLSSLKSIFELFTVQVSEFFKRFCLCFIQLQTSQRTLSQSINSIFGEYSDILESMYQHDHKLLRLITETYVLTRNMIKSAEHPCEKTFFNNSETTAVQKFNILIHDLELHLRATLMSVIDVEDNLKSQNSNTNIVDQTDTQNYFLKQINHLKIIGAELEASKDCFLNCFSFAEEKTFCKDTNEPSNAKALTPIIKSEVNSKLEVISDCDPVIEDEVYEAVIQHIEHEKNHDAFDAYPDDIAVDRKVSAYLMNELKKVLVSKAEEHKLREIKAIEAKTARQIKNPVSDSTIKNNPTVDLSDVRDNEQSFSEPIAGNITQEDAKQNNNHSCEKDSEQSNESLSRFEKPNFNDFSASIAMMALQRKQQFNLTDNTYEFSDNDNDDD